MANCHTPGLEKDVRSVSLEGKGNEGNAPFPHCVCMDKPLGGLEEREELADGRYTVADGRFGGEQGSPQSFEARPKLDAQHRRSDS